MPEQESGRGYRLKNVELFPVGEHKGKPYSERDIDDILKNFRNWSQGPNKLVSVPAVIGHEEHQPLLNNTGIPGVGNLESAKKFKGPCFRCDGEGTVKDADGKKVECPFCYGKGERTVILGDFIKVPESIAKLIDAGAYDHVSAEVYDKPPEGVPGTGKMLRRGAFLGGQLPHIKSLADLPKTDYDRFAELTCRHRVKATVVNEGQAGVYSVFSEIESVPAITPQPHKGNAMNRDEMLQKLVEGGMSSSSVEPLNDTQMAEICRMLEGEEPANELAEYDDEIAGLKTPEDINRIQPAFDKKEDAAKFRERLKRMAEYCKRKFGEEAKPEPPAKKPEEEPKGDQHFAEKFAEAVEKEVAKILGPVQEKVEAGRKQVDQFLENTRRSNLEAFCEAELKTGRISPAEMDRGNPKNPKPNLLDRLMRADAVTVVHTFSEVGQKVTKTELDLQMDEIKARPLNKFSEKVGGKTVQADQEVTKVEDYWESFAEKFTRMGTPKKELVDAFKAKQKRDPLITADQFLGSAA